MEASDIIARCGGGAVLAERFKLSEKAVEMWGRRHSIPGRWHVPLLLLARERGVELSLDDFATRSLDEVRA